MFSLPATYGGIPPALFGLFLVTEIVLSLSPGPAVLFVTSQGLAQGWRGAWPAALGIVSANAVYFLLSALGIGAALAAMPAVFPVLHWGGALYLLWLAWGAFTARPGALALAPDLPHTARRTTFRGALLLQLGNPKCVLFFTAVLPQFVVPQAPVPPQMAWLAGASMASEYLILLGYGWLGGQARRLLEDPRGARWAERACGVALALCAALVMAS